MKRLTTAIMTSLGLLALASACSVDTSALSEEEIASDAAAVCENPQATNAVMAGMAVAAAKELRRWLPARDLTWDFNTGMLALTADGRARCGGSCPNLQALLDLQKREATGTMIGGSAVDHNTLRARLKATYDRQKTCNSRPDNHYGDDCPVETHDLKFSSKTPGSCDTDFWFHAYKMGTTTALQYPAQLKNQLLWAGYPDNPYLAFAVRGDDVKIDPTAGLIDGDMTTTGSCSAACTKYSATSLIGQCCSCNGLNKTFSRSAFSYNYYQCK
ncbi:MAG TPA: hypothetical protein VER33_04410 [Polyangiaceae bacterium]|nr:hypothetical protein [Polyangiaceae bacterium]